MRGMVVAMLILGWAPLILFKPHIGVLVWDWVSHMIPHYYTFNFARTFPFLVAIFVVTAIGIVFSKDKTKLPLHPIVIVLITYWLWVFFTTTVAMDEGPVSSSMAWQKLILFSKVLVFALIAIAVMRSPNRLKAFVWVMATSLGFIAIKGGLFVLLTGGGARVQGAGGMMEDNNQLAMAMAMLMPIAFYLVQYPPHKIMKWPLVGASILVPVAAIGTQSRGGAVAVAAVLFFMLMKTKHKFKVLLAVSILGFAGWTFAPQQYKDRLATTESAATEDDSFRGRVSMWRYAVNLADDNPIEGGGFNVFYVRRAAELYMPPGFEARAPHSIYFEVIAEHGYVGLILFLTLLFSGWYAGGTQANQFRQYEETKWLGDMCAALQLSLVGFAAGGLTVNIATFDVFYHVLAIITMCHVVGERLMAGKLTEAGTSQTVDKEATSKKWTPQYSARS